MGDLPPLIRAYTLGLRHGLNAAVKEVLKDVPERPARWWPPGTLRTTLTRDCVDEPTFDAVDAWHTGAHRRFAIGRLWTTVPPERGDGSKLTRGLLRAIYGNLDDFGVPTALTLRSWEVDEDVCMIEASIEADALPEEVGFKWEVPEGTGTVDGCVNSAPSPEEGIRFLRCVMSEFPLQDCRRLTFCEGSDSLQEAIVVCMHDALVAGDDPQDLFGVVDGAVNHELTPLVCACKLGLLPCARWLVTVAEMPADDPIAREWGHPVLNTACAAGHTDVVRWLVDSCGVPPINLPAPEDRSGQPLDDALKHGRVGVVELLVTTYGVPLDRRGAFRNACKEGHLELARWLVETQGVSVVEEEAAAEAAPRQEFDVWARLSILTLCCESGNLPLCKWALSQGALLNGNTLGSPLDSICCGSKIQTDIVLWLVQQGARGRGIGLLAITLEMSCFTAVCRQGNLECAQAFWSLPAVREFEGDDARLMEAFSRGCGSGNMDLILWLMTVVGCGAVVQRACDGLLPSSADPLVAACRRGQLAVARWLVTEYGFTRLCHSPEQRLLLVHQAIESGDIDSTVWMMEQGQFAVDEMYASSLLPVEGLPYAHCTSVPWLVKEYGGHWANSRLLPNPTEEDRRWWRRRLWIFGLVTHASRCQSPHQSDDESDSESGPSGSVIADTGSEEGSESEVPAQQDSDSVSEGPEGKALEEEAAPDLDVGSDESPCSPAKRVCLPVEPESHSGTDAVTGADVDAAAESDLLALLLSPKLARVPGPHTGSSPAHLVSSIAGVCVSFLSDCCAVPGCPTQAPFVVPAE